MKPPVGSLPNPTAGRGSPLAYNASNVLDIWIQGYIDEL